MKNTVVSQPKDSNISIKFYVVFFFVILLPSINGQNSESDYESDPRKEKKGGARPFMGDPNDKRGGGRNFQFSSLKRGGARAFANQANADFDKRAGGRGFVIPMADKRDDDMDIERRGGARAFSMPLSYKRGGARPFYGVPEWKRGGGRAFSSFYQGGGTMKRGGGRAFQMERRGGARAFQAAFDKRGGGRGFQVDDNMDKRGGGRSFYGGNAIRSFYGGSPFSYEKKAVEYIPYYIDGQLKRGGAKQFGSNNGAWRQQWKRAGGRTFPIEDMDDSKEKRMIDEMSS